MMFWMLAACTEGSNEETLIDELRIVAVSVDAAADGDAVASLHWADPNQTGMNLYTAVCDPMGACEQVDQRALTEADGPLDIDVTLTEASSLWAVGCEPGLCDEIDLAADIYAAIESLPLQGTAIATRRLYSQENPEVAVSFDDSDITLDQPVTLSISVQPAEGVDDVWTAFGYTTAGGFDQTAYPVVDGIADLVWYPEQSEAETDLFIVVQGDLGGTAVWEYRSEKGL